MTCSADNSNNPPHRNAVDIETVRISDKTASNYVELFDWIVNEVWLWCQVDIDLLNGKCPQKVNYVFGMIPYIRQTLKSIEVHCDLTDAIINISGTQFSC